LPWKRQPGDNFKKGKENIRDIIGANINYYSILSGFKSGAK